MGPPGPAGPAGETGPAGPAGRPIFVVWLKLSGAVMIYTIIFLS